MNVFKYKLRGFMTSFMAPFSVSIVNWYSQLKFDFASENWFSTDFLLVELVFSDTHSSQTQHHKQAASNIFKTFLFSIKTDILVANTPF